MFATPGRHLVILLLALSASAGARAADFAVTHPGAGADATPGDGLCATASGACSLAAAMDEAAATSGPHRITILVAQVLAPPRRAVVNGNVTVTADAALAGGVRVLWGETAFVDVSASGTLRCERLHLDGFGVPYVAGHQRDYRGDGVFHVAGGRLELIGCSIHDPVTLAPNGGGAAIQQVGGSLLLQDCSIMNAEVLAWPFTADSSGAALQIDNADVVIESSSIGGIMFDNGGAFAIRQRGGTLSVTSSSIDWSGSPDLLLAQMGIGLGFDGVALDLDDVSLSGVGGGLSMGAGVLNATGCDFHSHASGSSAGFEPAALFIGSSVTAMLSDCTLSSSRGLALDNRGDLTLTDVHVGPASAPWFEPAVRLGGTTHATRCTFRDLSADSTVVSVTGDAELTECTFTVGAYQAPTSALSLNGGTLSLTGCDFANNFTQAALRVNSGTASLAGCTFRANERDGVVVSAGATASIDNCTFSGNAGAGLVSDAGPLLHVAHCTFADNGGAGVRARTGPLALRACVLSRNGSVLSPSDCEGTVESSGYVIAEAPSCDWVADATDVLGLPARLGGLVDNGGPTLTQVPLAGSPAREAVPAADCIDSQGLPLATDQRGFPRPFDIDVDGDARCDAGAVEDDGTRVAGGGAAIPDEPSDLEHHPLVRPLAVKRAAAALLWIDWQDVGAPEYDLYRATLAADFEPIFEAFGACGLEGPWAEIPLTNGSLAFVVAARSAAGVSSLGRSSDGVERAYPANACP